MGRRTTIHEIAQQLGLSTSTVSRALRGGSSVRESTREMVQQKAMELGYEPDVIASGLRKGKTRVVGIIVPGINRQFFSNLLSHAESMLSEAGYTVAVFQSHDDIGDEIAALKTLREFRAAGVLMSHAIEAENGKHIGAYLGEGTKLVQFDRVFADLPGAKVVNDNVTGSFAATSHLIENGYKKIAILGGYLHSTVFRERYLGYSTALRKAGFEIKQDLVLTTAFTREEGYALAKEALAKDCDAIYCTGDFPVLGVLDAVKEAGLTIPEDFGVIGTSNENFTEHTSPEISSLEQNPAEMGQRAAEAFLSPGNEDRTIVIPMKLMIRESSIRKKSES